MSPYRRNVMVGLVVLTALLALAWMLIQFGGNLVAPFAPANIPVRFVADRADGISNGSAVLYRGVNVGRVEKVSRSPEQLQVFIDAQLDKQPPLPGNVRAIVRSTGLIGSGAAIVLELTEPTPHGILRANATIDCRFVGLDLIPTEIGDLAHELRLVTKDLRESNLIGHINDQVEHLGKVIDSIQSLVDDPRMREDLRGSLTNIRATTEKLDKFTADLHQKTNQTADALIGTSKEMTARLEQASKLLDQLNQIAEKVNKGQGTAGALVNDSKLYEALVDTATELKATAGDLRRLIQQWEQEGLPLKVK